MTYLINIQNASEQSLPLTRAEIKERVSLVLRDYKIQAELTIRFVTPIEMIDLNYRYRHFNKTTNVLAFPCSLPEEVILEYPLLGDIIICPEVLREECKQFHKTLKSHYSLILIHGVLHLLGYDHIKDEEASIMQSIEVKLLEELGYGNPYDKEDD
jgi:probable rRNA maturation factor